MAGFKRNIWMVYWVVVTLTFILFALFSRSLYQSNIQKYQDKQLLQLELFSSSVDSLLKSQESLLEVVGRQLILKNDFTLTAAMQIRPILDDLMRIHSAIAGFGLTDAEGNFLTVSSNIHLSDMTNLKLNPVSRESFLQTLNSDRMVLGRTYFMPALQTLVIPIRKAIRDRKGNVIAVMTAGLKVDSTLVFRHDIHDNPFNRVSLIREDLYRTFISAEDMGIDPYSTPVEDVRYRQAITAAAANISLTEAELKRQQKPVTFITNSLNHSEIMTVKYLADYQLWAVSTTDMRFLNQTFHQQFGLYLLIFFAVQLAFYGLVRSIAENEKETLERLNYQATHDALTDLPNRLYLRNTIPLWTKNKTAPFALLFIDIDNFKSVNDTHGHDFGDQVLKQIAQRLSSFLTPERLIVREASDEFIMLVRETDPSLLRILAKEMITSMSQTYLVNDMHFLLSCSIGIAVYPTHGSDLDALLRAADISMYQAKQERNSFRLFTTEMQADHLYKMRVEQRLRLAIENKSLSMVYQPQVDVHGHFHGVEALVRWQDDELGFIPPDVFIPIAESSGLMVTLGKFIIERSVNEMALYVKPQRHKLNLSINISVKQFMQKDFSYHLLKVIEEANFDRESVTLEITENLFIEDLQQFKPICQEIHQLGLKISLDDFGTGYSSLSMLKALPIDELKIDKSFVDHIEHDAKSYNMVRNIIAIGKNFGMAVLAEGVETQAQADLLAKCHCDLLQGYYYSKPLDIKALAEYLDKNTPHKAG